MRTRQPDSRGTSDPTYHEAGLWKTPLPSVKVSGNWLACRTEGASVSQEVDFRAQGNARLLVAEESYLLPRFPTGNPNRSNEVAIVGHNNSRVAIASVTIVNKMRSQGNIRAFLFSFDASGQPEPSAKGNLIAWDRTCPQKIPTLGRAATAPC